MRSSNSHLFGVASRMMIDDPCITVVSESQADGMHVPQKLPHPPAQVGERTILGGYILTPWDRIRGANVLVIALPLYESLISDNKQLTILALITHKSLGLFDTRIIVLTSCP